MRTEKDPRAVDARRVWPLTTVQLLLVAAYAHAVIAYLATDAEFFPEQSPPGWSWPAVVVVGIGFVPGLLCLAVALPRLTSTRLRVERSPRLGLGVASALTALMLVVMATPPGWELFDWYVS